MDKINIILEYLKYNILWILCKFLWNLLDLLRELFFLVIKID